MNKLLLQTSLAGCVLSLSILGACGTDNGDVHGQSFGPVPERDGSTEAGDDGSVVTPEGGSPDAADGQADGGSCTGTIAVLAGNDTTLTGAAQIGSAAWAGGAITGGAAKSRPAIVSFGSPGFLALTRGPADALQALSFTTTWGAVAGVAGASTVDTPALTVVGTTAESVFLAPGVGGGAQYFYRSENSGTAWGAPAAVTSGAAQSFGQSGASVAAAGTDLVLAQDGGDNDGLYTQVYSGTWTTGAPVNGAGTLTTAPPVLLAIPGANDLVLVYADNTANHVIGYALRNAGTKAWNTATATTATAQTGESPQLALISATTIVATFRGNNLRPYWMTGTIGTTGITWSVPGPLLADTSTVDSAPAVAKGTCGDDAIAVFADAGQVKATRLRGTTWTVPEAVTGASGSRVAIATR